MSLIQNPLKSVAAFLHVVMLGGREGKLEKGEIAFNYIGICNFFSLEFQRICRLLRSASLFDVINH